jgi:hypothetical protein
MGACAPAFGFAYFIARCGTAYGPFRRCTQPFPFCPARAALFCPARAALFCPARAALFYSAQTSLFLPCAGGGRVRRHPAPRPGALPLDPESNLIPASTLVVMLLAYGCEIGRSTRLLIDSVFLQSTQPMNERGMSMPTERIRGLRAPRSPRQGAPARPAPAAGTSSQTL